MKTRKLRLVSALLAVAMMVLLAPTAALAATETTADGFKYEVTMDGEAYIIGYNGSATEVEIPSTLDGKTVTKIGSHDIIYTIWGNNQVTSVKIPSTVKTIEVGVFAGCTNLTTVDLSEAESLDSIGAYAFQDSGLTSVCIPANVAEISLGAFYGCKNLQTVDLSKAINLKVIGVDAFSGIIGNEPSIAEITIPAGVTEIGSGCFSGCKTLKEVTFEPGSQLERVDERAFDSCDDNMKIYYSDSKVETALSGKVGSAKMVKCVKVTFDPNGGSEVKAKMVEKGQKADPPTNPTRVGWNFSGWYTKDASGKWADEAFNFNTPITDDMILYARWTVGDNCGAEGNENNVHWTLDSDGTLTISGSGEMADYDKKPQPWADQRDNIKKLVVENGVTSIGDSAFRGCINLKNIDLSKASSLEVIKTSFPVCTGLENVVLNEGLVEIGGSAFNNCTSLGSIHIPSTVTAIGGWCFESCTSLSEVTFAADSQLTTIAVATFANCSNLNLETITIPKKVKAIQKDAFNGCRGLKSVTFEPGSELETIGNGAFEETAISEISIPASVKTIGSYVFRCVLNDSKLTKVIFESPSKLNTVNENAFRGCSATIYGDDNVMNKLNGIVGADKIKPANLTVTFDSNNGNAASIQTVANGGTVTEPTAPTRKGYKFMGWYEKFGENEYKPFDFSTAITDNVTLYAQWEEVPVDTYVVTVENGVAWVEADAETEAVAAGESICVPEGVTVHVKADETALEGMTFERWEVRKGEVKLENDRAAETTFTMPAGEVQLEAMYQAADANDSGWDAATVVTGAVIGTGTAILAYHIGMEVYAEQVLGKGVAVPRTRGEVALLAWQLAGQPEPNAVFTLLTDEAKAQQWAVESGLLQLDAEGNFHAEKKLSKWKALRVLDAAKKMG